MQYMPDNFIVGWDALALLPAQQTAKLFTKALAAETRSAVGTVTAAEVLKAFAKCDAGTTVAPKSVRSAVAVVRLLASDIYNLQISDEGSFRKRMARQLSKIREVSDADEALFEAIGAALSEDAVAPQDAPAAVVGGCTTIINVDDVGIETDLVSGKQRLYVSATAADATRFGAADSAAITFHPTAKEAVMLTQQVFAGH